MTSPIQPITPVIPVPRPPTQRLVNSFEPSPVYTLESVGPANKNYIQPDGFTQVRLLEMGIPIAHFMGCMARVNAQKLLKIKQKEVSLC